MQIILYETHSHDSFAPLNRLIPVAELRCGVFSFYERMERHMPDSEILLALPSDRAILGQTHYAVFKENSQLPEYPAFVNASSLIRRHLLDQLQARETGIWMHRNRIVMARLDRDSARTWAAAEFADDFPFSPDIPRLQTDRSILSYGWELLQCNMDQMAEDFTLLSGFSEAGETLPAGTFQTGGNPVLLRNPELVAPGVIFDTQKGAIVLEENVRIGAGSVLQGPMLMKENSECAPRSVLRAGTHIGPQCKVGGEISNSLIQGFSNKSHDGFLGDSYIGSWCNFGAGTQVSNLKNNYSTVKVWNQGGYVDTGLQFQGLIMGDYSRTAIGTRFNTGTVVDVGANVFCPDFPPRYVAPFAWGGDNPDMRSDFSKFLTTARAIMERRGQTLDAVREEILTTLYSGF